MALRSEIPKVSVGLPIYNSSRFLAPTIESILDQSFTDFELLIQDNASTDQTEEMCRSYAAKDPRIDYVRNAENVGAATNFNLVFPRARGKYFKWAADDDLCAPNLLEFCVKALDADPSIVLAAGQTLLINDDGSPVEFSEDHGCYVDRHGNPVGQIDPPHRAEGLNPAKRYWDILVRTMRTFEIFGLIRSDALRKTVLMESYYGSDKVLLAELSLIGRFHMIPETLLSRRCHENQSSRLSTKRKGTWIGSRLDSEMLIRIKKLIPAYFRVVSRSPISLSQKMQCYATIAYRFVAPVTWRKHFKPGLFTDTA